ncbi:hypothetical protein TNCV_152911 [Trichonephila clavipes]|nr:hypothetical protein TNCV_152911 [Trichonephila clavipes]
MSGLVTKRDRDKGRKWEFVAPKKKYERKERKKEKLKELNPTSTSTGRSIEENLIGFLAITESTGEYLTKAILGELEKKWLTYSKPVVDKDTTMVKIW